jgi:hypothetical protein
MKAEVGPQHAWLRRLVGEWTYESVPLAGADPAAPQFGGSEAVRALGEVWVLFEGRGQGPDGSPAQTQLTLGYDPLQQRFVGTWIGSMMNHLWVYRGGVLDAAGRLLSLDAEGPAFDGPPGTLAQYRDVIEIVGPDERLLHGHLLAPDGSWSRFMTMRYRRSG